MHILFILNPSSFMYSWNNFVSQQKHNSTYLSFLYIDKYTHHILGNVIAYIKYLSYKNILKYLMIRMNGPASSPSQSIYPTRWYMGVNKHLFETSILYIIFSSDPYILLKKFIFLGIMHLWETLIDHSFYSKFILLSYYETFQANGGWGNPKGEVVKRHH